MHCFVNHFLVVQSFVELIGELRNIFVLKLLHPNEILALLDCGLSHRRVRPYVRDPAVIVLNVLVTLQPKHNANEILFVFAPSGARNKFHFVQRAVLA